MQRIEPAERVAEAVNLVVANTIGCIEFQILRHPHLVTDSRVLVHLPVASIRERAPVRFAIGVHPFSRANDCRIKRIDRLLGSRGCVIGTGRKESRQQCRKKYRLEKLFHYLLVP